jgi:hypothetical protein
LKGSPDSESPELKYSKLEYASALLRTRVDAVGRGIAFCGSEEVFFAIITIGIAMMIIRAKNLGTAIFIEDVGVRILKTVAIAAYCITKSKNTALKNSLVSAIRILDKTGRQRYPSTSF